MKGRPRLLWLYSGHAIRCALSLAILWAVSSSRAEDNPPPAIKTPARKAMNIAQELDADYSYVGGAQLQRGHTDYGSLTEQLGEVKYVFSPQVTRDFLLRVGAEWRRFTFGIPDHAPVPDVLQQVSAVIGCDFQLADRWLVRAELQPGVYSDFSDISWRDANMPLIVGALFLKSADLQFVIGLQVDVRSEYPVLPAAGARWKFAEEWTLNLIMPSPRIEYEANEKLVLYAGANVESGTFKVSDRFGQHHGDPKLDHASLDYFEIRTGPGLVWKVLPDVTVEIEAGAMLHREFRFVDEDTTIRSHAAPYGQIACHARF